MPCCFYGTLASSCVVPGSFPLYGTMIFPCVLGFVLHHVVCFILWFSMCDAGWFLCNTRWCLCVVLAGFSVHVILAGFSVRCWLVSLCVTLSGCSVCVAGWFLCDTGRFLCVMLASFSVCDAGWFFPLRTQSASCERGAQTEAE